MVITTPNLSHELLGITEAMRKEVVPIKRDVWLVMVQVRSLRPYGPPVWRPAAAFFDEGAAQAYHATLVGPPEWSCIVRCFTWEQREIWFERAQLPVLD